MKKVIYCLLGIGVLLPSFVGITHADTTSTTNSYGGISVEGEGLTINANAVKGIGVAGAKEGKDTEAGLIAVIKNFINWVLGILSLITLGLLLWGGFQMVTANGDDGKFKKGFTILKQAAGGLAFIAVSWFLVSIIFWVIGNI